MPSLLSLYTLATTAWSLEAALAPTDQCHEKVQKYICLNNQYDSDCEKAEWQPGNCTSAGFTYCLGSSAWWTAGDDPESCAAGAKFLQERNFSNNGCAGKTKPLPCSAPEPILKAPCHVGAVDSSSSKPFWCQEYEEDQVCEHHLGSSAHAGGCEPVGWKYCLFNSYGQAWFSDAPKSCAEGQHQLHSYGSKNDGCNGKTQPLPNCSTVIAV
jgi:hypothetical protein